MRHPYDAEALLQGYSPKVRALTETLRRLVRETVPDAEERAYPGWRAIIYHHGGLTHDDSVCYLSLAKDRVSLAFMRGTELPDPDGLLKGTGKTARSIPVRGAEDVRTDAFRRLIAASDELVQMSSIKARRL